MEIKKHFKERYVQRITGLTDILEIKQYIVLNDNRIIEDITKMFEFAKFLYRGQVGKNNTTCSFYIADNIIIVADQYTNLMTLYRVDFNFPEDINRLITKGLLNEIEKLQEAFEDISKEINGYIEQRTIDIENIDVEIKILEKQVELKKNKKKSIELEVTSKRSDAEYINKDIEKYVNQLCNSLGYKKAMAEIAIDN